MSTESPFTRDRFEYEEKHLYFLQDEAFKVLEAPKPVYVVGSRGTGKTTLLKALNWRERLVNESLLQQLDQNVLHAGLLGTYIKLPEIQLGLVERWLAQETPELRAALLAMYLDLLFVEDVCDAVAKLTVTGKLDLSVEDEQEAVEQIVESNPQTFRGAGSQDVRTARELRKAVFETRRYVETAAYRHLAPAKIIEQLPLSGSPGSFGRRTGEIIAGLIAGRDRQLHFKVCFDEGECLSDFQLLVLNSMVRQSKWPVFHVAAFVSQPRLLSETVIPNLTLQHADRNLLLLDQLSPRDFRELAIGVASVRVENVLREPGARFDVDKTLGQLDINRVLGAILKTSVSPVAKRLLGRARELESDPAFVRGRRDVGEPGADTENARRCRSTRPTTDTGLSDLPGPDTPASGRQTKQSEL
jgi:hypothetical protein